MNEMIPDRINNLFVEAEDLARYFGEEDCFDTGNTRAMHKATAQSLVRLLEIVDSETPEDLRYEVGDFKVQILGNARARLEYMYGSTYTWSDAYKILEEYRKR